MKTFPAVASAVSPDPQLCASVYSSGRLCEVVAGLVAPFWRRYRGRGGAEGGTYLWLMRYARCGEHLKIRLHAPAAEVPLLRELLLEARDDYFSRPVPPPALPRTSTPAVPPVDAEDAAETDYPDRSFHWSAYGRSPLSLGDSPFLEDDGYCALLTRCLAAGTEIVLDRLESGPDGRCPFSIQREIWREALLTGLPAAGLPSDERALYLLYHRDSLLRSLRKRRRWTDGAGALAQVIAKLDRQSGREELRQELAAAVAGHEAPGRPEPDGALGAWHEALGALGDAVSPRLADPAYHVDPFAGRPVFPVLLKVFHGLANQLGLDAVNEAYLYHSLLDASGAADLRARPVRLRPDL